MNRNHPFLSSRRDGDAIRRCTLATVATALLLLAPVTGAQRTGDTATPQGQQSVVPIPEQQEQQRDEQQQKTERQKETNSNVLERKALSAHKKSDTGPVENWFGCPPKRDPNATRAPDSEVRAAATGETKSGEDACDPDASANDSPQKKGSTY